MRSGLLNVMDLDRLFTEARPLHVYLPMRCEIEIGSG